MILICKTLAAPTPRSIAFALTALIAASAATAAPAPFPTPTKPAAEDASPPPADSDAARRADWLDNVTRSFGVAVVKLRDGAGPRVVLFKPTSGGPAASSRIAKLTKLNFASAEKLHDFLEALGAGVRMQDGSSPHGTTDDAGIIEPFTSDEKRLLGIGDPLQDERDLEELKSAFAHKVSGPNFDWVRRGTLYWLTRPSGGVCQYRAADGRFSVITGNPRKVAALISEEINDVRALEAFVRERLPHVALYFLAKRNSVLITPAYLAQRAKFVQPNYPPSEAFRASTVLLQKHAVDVPSVRIEENAWSLTMPVLNPDGSIARWEMDGAVSPFAIATTERRVVEPAGAVVHSPLAAEPVPPGGNG